MDAFEFRNHIIEDYQRFSRSFTTIRANDIRQVVEQEYKSGRFWPSPLIQLNPNFVSGGQVDELVELGLLDPECSKIFRIKDIHDTFGRPMTLHQHQVDAIKVALKKESYVLTTGTGSGKSLSYFIPIINDVLRRKRKGESCNGITAIVVYPMNALCNSQMEELEKYLRLGYGDGKEPVTFARYTGQESEAERDRISKNPPDILLTNYVMLELIMTRFLDTDKAIREHAQGLRFLVLDELHTYRGRQGADVAMLVRRVRERFNPDLLCIGTSATMASEGSTENRNRIVASIASKIFGVNVKEENIITETLEPVTRLDLMLTSETLVETIKRGVPENLTYKELTIHPVAVWVERNLGLEKQDGKLVRISRPKTIEEAASKLAKDSGLQVDICQEYLKQFLLMAYMVKNEKGRSFFAFRLHQFISGAGSVYATLEPPNSRYITLNGQQFQPGNRDKFLYSIAFCRECGQEYFPVWATMNNHNLPTKFNPRELTERSNENEDWVHGYLMIDSEDLFDPWNLEEHFPEDWLEYKDGKVRLKSNYRKYMPKPVKVNTHGEVDDSGVSAWFIPGSFRFCLNPECGVYYDSNIRSDLSKLTGLSSEGRSSATTVITLSALRYLIGSDLDSEAKKLLGFTDNRQDASLQAGHFNDFIQILLLRSALLAAIQNEPDKCLYDEVLTQKVLDRLNLVADDFATNPDAKGIKAQNTLRTLRDVLGYRLYFDLQRGWRITSPNLEQLKLLEIRYRGLMECCEDEEEWGKCHPLLAFATPQQRFAIAHEALDQMRKSLCIKTIYLDSNFHDQLRNRSFNELKEPWGLSEDERLYSSAYMIPRSKPKNTRLDLPVVFISYRSRFGRRMRAQSTWKSNPHYPKRFDENTFNTLIDDLLSVLLVYGYVEKTELENGYTGYRINASVLEWGKSNEFDEQANNSVNRFFRTLYENISKMLQNNDRFLHQLEAREHTAQVDADIREEREMRFRKGIVPKKIVDGKIEPAGLPVLFCSPTMELGVDIKTLNTVYLRNAPPTPANYAQRSGRAGRSGQPALVITYCAAKSPHDQYFFSDPTRMVAGAVSPPTIELANEDLIRSHLHAVWLAETGVKLDSSISKVLDLESLDELPLRSDIVDQIHLERVRQEAMRRSERILSMMKEDLTPTVAPWYTETWFRNVILGAAERFDNAFRRWRSLYRATSTQMRLANDVLSNAVASEQERREAKARYDEAYMQQNLLLESKPTMNSDFYTYRYLASEGFLPGYNFPRLPLMAYIPGRKEKVVRDGFLSRPRFVGLSEFGPQSIIYHEGSTYRVKRAILTIHDENSISTTAKIPLQAARICPNCGYGHFGEQRNFERCINCDQRLEGGKLLLNLHRIEQVATRRATRITSDEEERQRQGYEMITTFRYSEEDGRIRCEALAFNEGGEKLIELRYGPSATIWRINLGWKRRQNKSIYGFVIDVNTGEWTKDSQAPTEVEDDNVREGGNVERVTPYVEDTKNVLILHPFVELSQKALVTLQYALKRGIENVFQLEEAELAAEPLPDSTNREAILFYEAAEGGAGVLTRLVTDPNALARVARKALEICHFTSDSGDWRDIEDIRNLDHSCEAGCYRCLLSYYNQTEHVLIDRKDPEVINLLCRLMRAESDRVQTIRSTAETFDELINVSTSSLEKEWLHYLKRSGYILPDKAQPFIREFNTRPDFAYAEKQVLVYIDGPHHENDMQKQIDAQITQQLEDAGFTVIRFPKDRSTWPVIISEYAWVFGVKKG